MNVESHNFAPDDIKEDAGKVVGFDRFKQFQNEKKRTEQVAMITQSLTEAELAHDRIGNYLHDLCEKYASDFGNLEEAIGDEIVELEILLDKWIIDGKLHTQAMIDGVKKNIDDMEKEIEKSKIEQEKYWDSEMDIISLRERLFQLAGEDGLRRAYSPLIMNSGDLDKFVSDYKKSQEAK